MRTMRAPICTLLLLGLLMSIGGAIPHTAAQVMQTITRQSGVGAIGSNDPTHEVSVDGGATWNPAVSGNDLLDGSAGMDFLSGGAGDDAHNGNTGLDICIDLQGTNAFSQCP